MKRMILTTVTISALLAAGSVRADVKLSGVFGNQMVIQQERPIRVFGTAEPGEKITVELAGKTATVTARDDGYFRTCFGIQELIQLLGEG